MSGPARVGAALRDASARIAAVSGTPLLDAQLLMAHALGIARETLLLGDQARTAPAAFDTLVARRLDHEPVAYIVGSRDFWTITLEVTPAVLIPRPDSETLIEAALAHFGEGSPARILDLGTGSGALLLAALAQWPEARGLGVDDSRGAVRVARRNARRLGMNGRARFARGGWGYADRGYELVLCNPPYVALGEALPREVIDHEPRAALFGGDDGLDEYRRIAPVLRLPPGGVACIEIGASQAVAVRALLEAEGFAVAVTRDLGGRDRCIVATPAA